MRFEICETVHTPDPEMVLRALEICSREFSSEVIRYGDRITLRGLGPSPRAKNAHDTTVFCVNAEDDKTVISGEINFQASALVGTQPQRDIVRSKLDDLFEQMKAQIDLDARRTARSAAIPALLSSPVAVLHAMPVAVDPVLPRHFAMEESVDIIAPEAVPHVGASLSGSKSMHESSRVEHAQRVEAEPTDDTEMTAEPVLAVEPELIAEPEVAFKPELTANPELAAEPEVAVEPQMTAEPKLIAEPELTAEAEVIGKTAPDVESKQTVDAGLDLTPKHPVELEGRIEPEHRIDLNWNAQTRRASQQLSVEDGVDAPSSKGVAKWIVGLIAVLLMAFGSYFFYRTHRDSTSTAAYTATSAANPLPAINARPVNATPATVPPKSQSADPAANVTDLKLWLENWAAAMRTRDASAQAAFYADTVDRYVGKFDVSRDMVLKDREATIRMRKGLWTVKMEQVVIERQTRLDAEVRLVKHFIDQPAQSEILESFVPTRLTIKRFDGSWRITSEQDLAASSRVPTAR